MKTRTSSVLVLGALLSFPLFANAQDAVPAVPEATATEVTATPLPSESIYHLDDTWTTQSGQPFQLSELRGHPVVALLFYGSCAHVCPILIHDVQGLDAALTEEARANTRFLLVTVDPTRDTPEALTSLAADKEIDLDRYVLLNGSDIATRSLAAMLHFQYRTNPNGSISHSNVITLLDENGVVVENVEGLRQDPSPIVDLLNQ